MIILLKKGDGMGWSLGCKILHQPHRVILRTGLLFSWKAQGLFRHPNGINAIVAFVRMPMDSVEYLCC